MNENIFEQALELCKDLDFFHRWLSKRDSQLLQSKLSAIEAEIKANQYEAYTPVFRRDVVDAAKALEIVRKHLGGE